MRMGGREWMGLKEEIEEVMRISERLCGTRIQEQRTRWEENVCALRMRE